MTYPSLSTQSEQGRRGSDQGRDCAAEARVGHGSVECTWFLVSRGCGRHLIYLRPQVPMNHGNSSTMDIDVTQDEQLNKAIAESLAMSTTADEVDEILPPEAWIRKDDR